MKQDRRRILYVAVCVRYKNGRCWEGSISVANLWKMVRHPDVAELEAE